MPNLARSCLGLPVWNSSMAQQARPNVAGHTDRARAQPAAFSTEVSRMPLGSFSSMPIVLIPFQAAAPPDVGVGNQHGDHEGHHLDQAEGAELVKGDRP